MVGTACFRPALGGYEMKKALLAVLVVANLALLVVGIITIPPNFSKQKQTNPSAQRTSNTTRDEKKPTASTSPPTASSISQATTNEIIPSESTSLKTSKPSQTTRTTTEAASLSTTDRPDLSDFLWYVDDVLYNGLPEKKTPLTEFEKVTGGWKALIMYDPDNEQDASAIQFLNINISGASANVKLTLDWYLIFWANVGESVDETDLEDSSFTGRWENNGLWASGAGTIRLTEFYSLNGNHYAVGIVDTPDGIPATIALTRP